MNKNSKIKVIKKGTQKVVEQRTRTERPNAKTQVREMVGNVTSWVSEFQHRKSEEAKVAIDQLFGQQPQPSGV